MWVAAEVFLALCGWDGGVADDALVLLFLLWGLLARVGCGYVEIRFERGVVGVDFGLAVGLLVDLVFGLAIGLAVGLAVGFAIGLAVGLGGGAGVGHGSRPAWIGRSSCVVD